jgi:hypothetical protein
VCNLDVTLAVTASQTILLLLPGRSATLPHDPIYGPEVDTIIQGDLKFSSQVEEQHCVSHELPLSGG